MAKQRIALDMDEVIADVRPKLLDAFEQRMGWRPSGEEYAGKKIYELEGAAEVRNVLHTKGFFADLPVMPGSREVVRELMEDYELFIITAAMEFRFSFEDKYNWLATNFPFIPWKNIVFCGDKRIIQADYMIDDHVRNLETFGGKGLLYTASHNLAETRFRRVNDWKDVRAFFEEEKKVRAGGC